MLHLHVHWNRFVLLLWNFSTLPLVIRKGLFSITKNPELLCRKTVRRLLSLFLKPKDRSYKSQLSPWNEVGNTIKMHHLWFAQKGCFRVRGYRICLDLVSWRFSLGKVGGKSQAEGWTRGAQQLGVRASGGCLGARTAAYGACQRGGRSFSEETFPSLASVACTLCSEGKKEYCFTMGKFFVWLILLDSLGEFLVQGSGSQLMLC